VRIFVAGSRPIPKEVYSGLRKMKMLEAKEKELSRYYKDIQSVSPFGQLPPVAEKTLNKELELNQRRAKIWNRIRNFVVTPKGRTLWQLSLERGKYPVKSWGKETVLQFTSSDVEELLKTRNRG